ncbi:fibrinolytic enzyme, isozyme C-like [Physella acuta]|uniref:fibrinolytic enzyme, isozyme C-like n=1 Tax=Physella acuta TaxID=109671 RepID=UPI0027DD40AB|nr:fibrinolytic enzyme, isozyme C-like [Physella acuta]
MNVLLVFIGLVVPTLAAPEKRIVNGQAASLFEHPHQVSLQAYSAPYGWYHTCGGVLIAVDKVLTAAHCVDKSQARNLRVIVGALNLNSPNEYTQTLGVASYVMHELYNANGNGYPNDIAVIYLQTPATLNRNVQLASLAPKGSSFADTTCVITGWGRTSGTGSTSTILLEAHITKITREACHAIWSQYGVSITAKHICVYEESGSSGSRPSSCMGDSGGPMMCGRNYEYRLVTSWGASSCSGDFPSVYTRVSEYVDWVNAHL